MKSFIDVKDLKDLKPGDLVKHKLSEEVYTVIGNYGERVTAVSIADVTNTVEWQVLTEAKP